MARVTDACRLCNGQHLQMPTVQSRAAPQLAPNFTRVIRSLADDCLECCTTETDLGFPLRITSLQDECKSAAKQTKASADGPASVRFQGLPGGPKQR